MDTVGTSKLMTQMADQMLASLQKNIPDVPPTVWAKFRARIKPDELIVLLLPVYDKYYTSEDLTGLLAFYQSSLGQKVIATLPQVSRESQQIGEKWGQQQAAAVIREYEQEQARKRPASTKRRVR